MTYPIYILEHFHRSFVLKFDSAFRAILKGQKVTRPSFKSTSHIALDTSGEVTRFLTNGGTRSARITSEALLATDWSIKKDKKGKS